MAERLNTFPGDDPGPQQKYPWTDWTDGSVWQIRRGEDYDVATENMRVNLHMKADSLARKVRTKKTTDEQGEGLVFQFLASEDMEAVQMAQESDPQGAKSAMNALYADALEL